jgi:hypothetical protein
MISGLDDEQLLEYLLTSDYIENYKPEEYRYLLHKFKYYYRILWGRKKLELGELEMKIKFLESELESKEKTIYEELTKSANLQNKIDLSEKERKLTWRERIMGKIKKF